MGGSVVSEVTIYHNPNCGTPRNVLGLTRNAGIEPTIIEYLKAPGGKKVIVNEEEVQTALGKHVNDLKQEGLDAKLQMGEVMAGGAANVIAEIADEEKADLIVAGTTGSGYIAGLLLGSVTQRLAQIAHCPVLVVPSSSAGASTS
jgi:nucleotide-binding universal stress UspA family protein